MKRSWFCRAAESLDFEGTRSRNGGRGVAQQARHLGCDVLQLEGEVWGMSAPVSGVLNPCLGQADQIDVRGIEDGIRRHYG
jgi:hypothetical protein